MTDNMELFKKHPTKRQVLTTILAISFALLALVVLNHII